MNKQNTLIKKLEELKRKRGPIGVGRKVYGVPKLPLAVDAMYENKLGGAFTIYYHDSVRNDPVYGKLEMIAKRSSSGPMPFEDAEPYRRVARHYMDDMLSRQMNKKTYDSVKWIPAWALKIAFSAEYLFNQDLRTDMFKRKTYARASDRKEWIDIKE